jgi:hypothetical protein
MILAWRTTKSELPVNIWCDCDYDPLKSLLLCCWTGQAVAAMLESPHVSACGLAIVRRIAGPWLRTEPGSGPRPRLGKSNGK